MKTLHKVNKLMNDQITIRKFNLKDMENVVNLLQSVSAYSPESSQMTNIADKFLKTGNCYACVAEHNGLTVGIGSIFIIYRIRGGSAAIIEDVATHEKHRNKGIGKLIVEKLLNYAQSKKCFKVTLVTSEKNINFYKKIGFEEDFRSMKVML
jgi:ribosomal protein S18 acetylase RimI-like enzyme